MAKRSKIEQLPAELKDWLERALVKGNFSGYAQLADELKKHGATLGLEADISKSGLHRYGSNLERKLSAIKSSTEAARLIAQSAPDDEDNRSGAVLSMIQTEVFEVLVALQDADAAENPAERAKLLSTVAKNMATLSRASVSLKRHQIEIRDKARAAADAAEKIGKRGGLSGDAIDSIRREILGIAA